MPVAVCWVTIFDYCPVFARSLAPTATTHITAYSCHVIPANFLLPFHLGFITILSCILSQLCIVWCMFINRSCGPGTAELHSTAVCLREAIGSFISLMMLHLGACIYSLLYSVSLPPLIRLDPFVYASPLCICPFACSPLHLAPLHLAPFLCRLYFVFFWSLCGR